MFAAVATPSTDPFSMLMLAIPMTLLFMVSEVIARVVDKRRRRASYAGLDDDEASPSTGRRRAPPSGLTRTRTDRADRSPRVDSGRPVRPAGVARHRRGDLDRAPRSVRGAPRIEGRLASGEEQLAVRPAGRRRRLPATAAERHLAPAAHQAWEHGQVLLVTYDGRLTLAVPGTAYSADGALETVGRLAKAVGVDAGRFMVCLRL